jgi:flagellar hook-associated protein 1 FlgK
VALPSILQTGRSGMIAAKVAISTAGHNITNANTEGYSRQRVETEAANSLSGIGKNVVGSGTRISSISRINDEYVEKQIRNAGRELGFLDEKANVLKQAEDIFNEMNGDGINRLMSRFFNEFRKLSNDPDNEAVRQSVREASQSLVNDFHRLRKEVTEVQHHIDARIEGVCKEINSSAEAVKELNIKINEMSLNGSSPNDLMDKRDQALKKLGSLVDLSMHKDNFGNYSVDVKGVGPLVSGPITESFYVETSPADETGKPDGSFDVKSSAAVSGNVTHLVKGGRLGALIEARDELMSSVGGRLDELAFALSQSVNEIHAQGFTREGATGVAFFSPLHQMERAAEFISLSDSVKDNANNIAAALEPGAPGDNRIAIAISKIQNEKIMSQGHSTMDDFYNSIVSDIGVSAAKNKFTLNQHKDIVDQLGKIRDQISGVSIDEETTNLMQFQQMFGAAARIIQVADELLKEVLDLRR